MQELAALVTRGVTLHQTLQPLVQSVCGVASPSLVKFPFEYQAALRGVASEARKFQVKHVTRDRQQLSFRTSDNQFMYLFMVFVATV
jgi:hypothetical protein